MIENTERLFELVDQACVSQTADHTFVDLYSYVNVVFSEDFASQWQKCIPRGHEAFEESMGLYSVRGNSRDDPTPMILHWTKIKDRPYTTMLWIT